MKKTGIDLLTGMWIVRVCKSDNPLQFMIVFVGVTCMSHRPIYHTQLVTFGFILFVSLGSLWPSLADWSNTFDHLSSLYHYHYLTVMLTYHLWTVAECRGSGDLVWLRNGHRICNNRTTATIVPFFLWFIQYLSLFYETTRFICSWTEMGLLSRRYFSLLYKEIDMTIIRISIILGFFVQSTQLSFITCNTKEL